MKLKEINENLLKPSLTESNKAYEDVLKLVKGVRGNARLSLLCLLSGEKRVYTGESKRSGARRWCGVVEEKLKELGILCVNAHDKVRAPRGGADGWYIEVDLDTLPEVSKKYVQADNKSKRASLVFMYRLNLIADQVRGENKNDTYRNLQKSEFFQELKDVGYPFKKFLDFVHSPLSFNYIDKKEGGTL